MNSQNQILLQKATLLEKEKAKMANFLQENERKIQKMALEFSEIQLENQNLKESLRNSENQTKMLQEQMENRRSGL